MNDNRLSIITDDLFKDALTIKNEATQVVHIMYERDREPHKRAHLYLLALFSCLWQGYDECVVQDRGVIRIQLRKFARYMGMDPSAGKSADIMAALATMEGYKGIFDGKPFDLLKVVCPEDEDHEVVLSMPYIVKVSDALADRQDESADPVCHNHIRASVCKARCIPAVDLAMSLMHTLVTRGMKPDGQFRKNQGVKLADRQVIVSRVKKNTLIRRAPSVYTICQSRADTDNKNIQLRRVFLAADKLLHEQTDIFAYCKDLKISGFVAPKMGRKRDAEMEENIIMRHYGANDLTGKEKAADQTTGGTTAV